MSTAYTVADLDRVMHNLGVIDGWNVSGEDGWSLFMHEEINNVPTELGVISHEKSFGGEGQGDAYWVVVKVTGEFGVERFFRMDGWYQSFAGGELDGEPYEVKPTPKTVVFYE